MKQPILIALFLLALGGVAGAGQPVAGDPSGPITGGAGPGVEQPLDMLDFGFGLQIDEPYKAPGDAARATLFFFNMTPQNAAGAWASMGGFGCRYFVYIRDAKRKRVWQPNVPCPLEDPGTGIAPMGPFPFPAGTFLKLPVDLTMEYGASETRDPDGAPLPGGPYLLEATHDYSGPVLGGDTPVPTSGGIPRAEVPFRIVECDGVSGPVTPRDLVSGDTSGYRYGDPAFYGEELVLRSREAATDFWRKHTANVTPPPAPPWVDFENEMVIVALLGTQSSGGGPDIRIVSVQEYDCYLLVTVRMDFTPGPLTVITNPYHMVAVPRSLKEVLFLAQVSQGP